LTTELRNPLTNAAFYVTIHTNSSSGSLETFKLHVNTSEGTFTIPRHETGIALNGHQSKIIVTDFRFGDAHLVYSTAEVLSYIITDGIPTVFFWVPDGESVEFYLRNAADGKHANGRGCNAPRISTSADGSGTTVSFASAEGLSVFSFTAKSSGKAIRVVVMDRSTAYDAWFPALSARPVPAAIETIFVQGPYLVRNVVLEGTTLTIYGDNIEATGVEIMAPSNVKTVSWNGKACKISRTSYGSLRTQLQSVDRSGVTLPSFSSWKSADSLPEISPEYHTSSAAWVGKWLVDPYWLQLLTIAP
jgi:beta-galactosidase